MLGKTPCTTLKTTTTNLNMTWRLSHWITHCFFNKFIESLYYAWNVCFLYWEKDGTLTSCQFHLQLQFLTKPTLTPWNPPTLFLMKVSEEKMLCEGKDKPNDTHGSQCKNATKQCFILLHLIRSSTMGQNVM